MFGPWWNKMSVLSLKNTHGHTLKTAVCRGGRRACFDRNSLHSMIIYQQPIFRRLMDASSGPNSHAYNMKQYQIERLSHVYRHNQACLYLESCIHQKGLKELMAAAFLKPDRLQNVNISGCHASKLCSLQPSTIDWLDKCMFPDISLRLCVQMMMPVSRGDRRPFVTLTCSGRGRAVWGRGRVAGEEWINRYRHADRKSVGHRHTVCTRSVCLPVCAPSAQRQT